jgi:hypothetical protein
MSNILYNFLYIILRVAILIMAIAVAYYLVTSVITPNILEPTCLINTDGCLYLDIYKYKNSFLAQFFPSALWIWFDGMNVYVYGYAPGTCQDSKNYEPVFSITPDFTQNPPQYTLNPNMCLTKLNQVKDYYENNLKVNKNRIFYHSEKVFMNVYDLITLLHKKKIIS